MKKKLLAAALLAGFAGAASAQSSVTLYGVVDVGIQYQNIKTGSTYARQHVMPDGSIQRKESFTNVGMVSGVQNGSRWGLKGVEDLGNGLKANFVYESGVTANTGASTGFTRQATLGLSSSSWGALDLGRRTSPGTYAFSGIDPFGAAFGTSALTRSFGTQFIRYSNMVMYTTPNFSGFTGSIGYSFDTGMGAAQMPGSSNAIVPIGFAPWSYETNNKTRALSIGLRYANGPLLVSAGYDRIQAPSSITMDSSKVDVWMLGGTYDFKVAKIHAAYGQQIGGVVGVWGLPTSASGNLPVANNVGGNNVLFAAGARTQSWMVGLSAPVTDSVNVFGSVQQMLPSGSFKTSPVTGVANQTVGSLGATYSLSKRTNLYAYYSHGSNMGMLSGVKVNTFTVGMRHRF